MLRGHTPSSERRSPEITGKPHMKFTFSTSHIWKMNYGRRFMTLYKRQGSRPSPWKRNAKKAKWLPEEAL